MSLASVVPAPFIGNLLPQPMTIATENIRGKFWGTVEFYAPKNAILVTIQQPNVMESRLTSCGLGHGGARARG